MPSIQPYLIFSGECEEAMNFYCQVFGGEVQFVQKYKDAPVDSPEHWKDKIMHANFIVKGTQLMASDTFPNNTILKGNNINLSVSYDKRTPPDEHFNRMAVGGKVTMPLQDTFWGARFGMVEDRYGVNWMFNQQLLDMKA